MSLSAAEQGIRNLVREHSEKPKLLGESLAQALKWQTSDRTNKELPDGVVVRGYVGAQPATVFVIASGSAKQELLSTAALYAYHASIEWGLLVDAQEATLFNSHWVLSNDWFTLPPLQWETLDKRRELLDAITPEGLTSGKIELVARKYREPDRLLIPVDDALVDRLDYWRDEVLRHSPKPQDVDEKLQAIFAQLFVLRAVEDRDLAPGIGNLLDLTQSANSVDLERLRDLFARAKLKIESELFDFDVISSVPEFVLAGIIRDLYIPRDLPGAQRHRYNFSWIDADVLGRAYEKYLSTLLVPVPLASEQLRFWHQPLRDAARTSVQRARGVYYTPPSLVRYLTERCLEHVWPRLSELNLIPRIADFSCGSGSFLTAAADYLLRRLKERDPSRNWAHEIINERHIVGVDIDARAVTLTRLSLWLRFAEEPHPLPLPRLRDVVVQADALGEGVWTSLPSTYDIVLGNPPFLAASRVQDRSDLSLRYQTARGRFDYSYLFVELALRMLDQDGVLGLVVPNRLFRNRDASTLRELLTTQGNLLTAVDFGVTEVFAGATVYIGAIVSEKTSRGEDGTVRVVKVTRLSRFLGVLLMQADRNGTFARDHLEAYDSSISAGSYPWMLLSPSDRKARVKISEVSQELASVAGVFQGIRTGANEIFVVDVISGGSGGLLQVRNGLGDTAILEASLLRSVVFGADIGRYDSFPRAEENWQRCLVYPYGENGVIPEAEMREYYPGVYKYLRNYQGILADRTSIAGTGMQWFELVRRRDERWLESKKLMTRDLAERTSFAVDLEGTVFLLGGTAVVPVEPDHLLALLGYLNSSVANWYLAQVVPIFRAGFQKIEPQHLNSLPVPSKVLEGGTWQDDLTSLVQRILHTKAAGDKVEQGNLEALLDSLVCEMVGIDPAEIQ